MVAGLLKRAMLVTAGVAFGAIGAQLVAASLTGSMLSVTRVWQLAALVAVSVLLVFFSFVRQRGARQLNRASKLVSNVTGFPVQYNKAIVGKNAFSHESGIHQDGMLKNVETYEIMRPEDVGVHSSSLVLGKLSGRHAFKDKLEALGYELDDKAFQEAFKRFKDLADKKKHVFDEDIVALVDDEVMRGHDKVLIRALRVTSGINVPPSAELTLSVDGQDRTAKTTGDGPVDAIFNAIRELYPHEASLQLFQIKSVTEGTDAQAGASVRLEENGRTVTGRAADTDTVLAAANAYVNALNKLLVKREKRAPETLTVAR